MVFENDETSMFRAVERNRREAVTQEVTKLRATVIALRQEGTRLRHTVTVLALCLLAAIALIIFLLMMASF